MGKIGWATFISGVGVSLMGISIGVIASAWPQYVKPHPYWVISLLAFGFALIVAPPLGLLFSRNAPPESVATSEVVSGLKNTGSMDRSMVTIGGHHTHQGSLVSEVPRPVLAISNALPMPLMQHKGVMWRRQHDGHLVTTVAVMNMNECDGWKAYPANDIVVSLVFGNADGPMRYVSRVYWVDHSENKVSIKIGMFKHFILGLMAEDRWTTFENERDQPFDPPENTGMVHTHYRMNTVIIPMCSGMWVDAKVFSDATGMNFQKRRFLIHEDGFVSEDLS